MRRGIACVAALIALVVLPAPALADHHLIKIREFFPGTAATANDAFLELQMYAAGQNLVGGHDIYVYPPGAAAPAVHTFNPDLPTPANAQSQRTILAAGTNSAVDADYPENFDSAPGFSPGAGAICFVSTTGFGIIDCVEWGTGNDGVDAGAPVLPSGIPDGSSVTRSIAPNCATLLEAADDTNDSATDFAQSAPTPRPNSVTPTETACPPGGGGGGEAPDTEITKAPKKKTKKTKAKFKFRSDAQGAEFECKLDKAKFKPCDSPRKYKRLDPGKHRFQVRASANGKTDPTPAKHRWKVV
jgi:hypothetical protein